MIGWIGTGLLLLAYLALLTKWSKWFIYIDIVASLTLTLHAALIHDIPFTIVNAFIAVILAVKAAKGGIK